MKECCDTCDNCLDINLMQFVGGKFYESIPDNSFACSLFEDSDEVITVFDGRDRQEGFCEMYTPITEEEYELRKKRREEHRQILDRNKEDGNDK